MAQNLESPLFTSITTFVNKCMSTHDPSHNPAHVHRVVNLARKILQSEQSSLSPSTYDAAVVDLAALLHDIGDRKYLTQVAEIVGEEEGKVDPGKIVLRALVSHGAELALAEKVQTIVSHVSYTTECNDPSTVRQLISGSYPELAIVQDADRLDAIGAIGIGRCFTFLGAKGEKFGKKWEMDNAIEHFGEKLEKVEGMMKTRTGRSMARVRTERLREFKRWWVEEMNGV